MTPEAIIAAYEHVARPIMLRYFGGDRQTCVAATRVTIETMRSFGLDAEPVAVQLVAQCKALKFAYISGFSARERKRIARRNGKPIQNRHVEGGQGYNGHVIAAVAKRWLVDASIDQIQSIEHGLRIEPAVIVLPLPAGISLKRLAVDLGATVDDGHQLDITYRSHGDYSFQASEAWEYCTAMKFVVAHIIAAMVKSLEEKTA